MLLHIAFTCSRKACPLAWNINEGSADAGVLHDLVSSTAPTSLDNLSDLVSSTAPPSLDNLSDVVSSTAPTSLDNLSDLVSSTAPINLDNLSDLVSSTAPTSLDNLSVQRAREVSRHGVAHLVTSVNCTLTV